MTPTGGAASIFLKLLAVAGIPAAIAAAVGTTFALYQWWTSLDDASLRTELGVLRLFSNSPRRGRALAIALISRVLAVSVSAVFTWILVSDPVFNPLFPEGRGTLLKSSQALLVALFMALDWWIFRRGDELPRLIVFIVGVPLLAMGLCYAALKGISMGSWTVGLGFASATFVWFKLLDWTVDSASGLARAIQNR